MTDTEKEAHLAVMREYHEEAMREVWLWIFKYLARLPLPRVPDYKGFRI